MFSPFLWAGDDQPYPGMEGAITSKTKSLSGRGVVSMGITLENSMTDPATKKNLHTRMGSMCNACHSRSSSTPTTKFPAICRGCPSPPPSPPSPLSSYPTSISTPIVSLPSSFVPSPVT